MNRITVKLPRELQEKLSRSARRDRLSQSELVRRALTLYLDEQARHRAFQSAADRAGDLAGSLRGGPPDLSDNPEHLDDFGRA